LVLPFPPKSRFRIYGGASKYLGVARDLVVGRLHSGSAVEDLERRAASFVGARHAVAMPQARVGIHLVIKTLVRPGQSVILSPYTIYDVINMVIAAGARPVFADIRRDTCGIDPAAIEPLIDDTTAAVMVTHLHGVDCGIQAIAEICARRNVPLIEDAAQAFGARVAGRRLGTWGRAGIYSTGMAKNVNSFYGGLVVTDDPELYQTLKSDQTTRPFTDSKVLLNRVAFCAVGDVLTWRPIFDAATFWIYRYGHLHRIDAITNRWRGEDDPVRRTAPAAGFKRMTPLQARLITRALDSVDAHTAIRIEHARQYHEGLRDIAEILLPPFKADGSNIYLTFPIQVPDRAALHDYMTLHGRDVAVQHIGNCADYEAFAEFRRDCPHARLAGAQVLLLPTYPSYGTAEVQRNIQTIRRFFDRAVSSPPRRTA
jgi:dTDP-4-amino-4,6-dideoxygalactose transaminase